jgi:hypothetical protein
MSDVNALSEPSSPVASASLSAFDGLQRARAMKADINTAFIIRQPKKSVTSRCRVEEDPINHLIKTLRQDHQMGWDAIATYLNEERLKRGEPGGFTSPAVYSRFVRNGPRIAALNGEVGFDPKDYMHLRNPAQKPNTISQGFVLGAGRKRVRRQENEDQELKGSVRTKSKLSQQARELEQADMTEALVRAVSTVEQNFWTFVADELERNTAKMFDARACESRYHSI